MCALIEASKILDCNIDYLVHFSACDIWIGGKADNRG